MPSTATSAYVPDALATLRDSFALHLDATRWDKTARTSLGALDALLRHLEAAGMPTGARGIKREHVVGLPGSRR